MNETINRNDIEEQIKKYISNIDGEFYPDELADKLNINFDIVMNIMKELIDEGFLEVNE